MLDEYDGRDGCQKTEPELGSGKSGYDVVCGGQRNAIGEFRQDGGGDMATPILMDSCMMTERRLFPLLASSDKSTRVTVFMAVNCVELIMPNMVKMTSISRKAFLLKWSKRARSWRPEAGVLTVRIRRYPNQLTSRVAALLAMTAPMVVNHGHPGFHRGVSIPI